MTKREAYDHPGLAEIAGIVEHMERLRGKLLDFEPNDELLAAFSDPGEFDLEDELPARFDMLALVLRDSLSMLTSELPIKWPSVDDEPAEVVESEAAA
jgi:hypothetical protein